MLPFGNIRPERVKHIEFFDENKFEEKFEELINEINAIEAGLGMRT
ncbi:unnamed protein product, partial [Adineta steineri]